MSQHAQLSVHALGLPAMSDEDFLQDVAAIGATQIGVVSDDLLSLPEALFHARLTALADTGVRICSIVHLLMPTLDVDLATAYEARERLNALLERAQQCGAEVVYLLTGGRGQLSWMAASDRFREVVGPCVERSRALGIQLAVENASSLYADIHIAHSITDARRLAQHAGIALCVELFFCWADADIFEQLEAAIPDIALVQVSDYHLGDRSLPNRAVPGDGDIPLKTLLGFLLSLGYRGLIDIELLGPRIETEGRVTAYARAVKTVSAWLTELMPIMGRNHESQ
jgi:sugar phosphate isomerase/epimerase